MPEPQGASARGGVSLPEGIARKPVYFLVLIPNAINETVVKDEFVATEAAGGEEALARFYYSYPSTGTCPFFPWGVEA